jgi:formylmethanofuran dehydrogenase subunit B
VRLSIESDGGHIVVKFTDGPHTIVEVARESLSDALEASISRFQEMQQRAIEELHRWKLINLKPTVAPTAEVEPS